MNRIYQARVSAVEISKPGVKKESEPLAPPPKLAQQKSQPSSGGTTGGSGYLN